MALLHAARHQSGVPALARWRLGCGIAATLAANLAAGIGHGAPGAVIAAWPTAALVFSNELLLRLVRAGAGQPEPPRPTSEDAALAAYRTSVASGAPLSAHALPARHDISRRAGSWPPWHTNPTALADSGPEVHHKLTGSVLPPTVVGGRTQPQAGGDDLRPPVQPRPLWLAARPHVAESNASSTTHRYAEQRIRMDGSRDLQLDLGTRTMSFRRFRPASRIIREHWPAEC
jgi:hypothetical protein